MNLHALLDTLSAQLDVLVTKVDGWVAGRKSSEVLMISLLIPAVLLFGAYELLIPGEQRKTVQARAELNRVHQELSVYRMSGGDEELELMRQQVESLNARIQKRQLAEEYLQSRLSELEHLYFTRSEWADHLRLIASAAAGHGVTLKVMENRVEEGGMGFLPVMRITLEGEGSFDRAMRFIHALEAGAKISPVERLSLEAAGGNRLAFKLETVLWGLK